MGSTWLARLLNRIRYWSEPLDILYNPSIDAAFERALEEIERGKAIDARRREASDGRRASPGDGEGMKGVASALAPRLSGQRVIAVPPFQIDLERKVDTSLPSRFADELTIELMGATNLRAISGADLRRALAEVNLTPDDLYDPETIPKLGRWTAADCIALSTAYKKQYFFSGSPRADVSSYSQDVTVAFQYAVKVYDLSSGTVVASAMGSSPERFAARR